MYYDLNEKLVWCDYDKIWSVLMWRFNLTDDDINALIKNVFKVSFNVNIIKAKWTFSNLDKNK